jgi:hypothetical protein
MKKSSLIHVARFIGNDVLPVTYNNFDISIHVDYFIERYYKTKKISKSLNIDEERHL